MRFAKLLDKNGRQIARPKEIPGTISFDARTGEAQAWAEDGRTLLATMTKARVVWMGLAGIRLEGMEPIEGINGTRFLAMEWQHIY